MKKYTVEESEQAIASWLTQDSFGEGTLKRRVDILCDMAQRLLPVEEKSFNLETELRLLKVRLGEIDKIRVENAVANEAKTKQILELQSDNRAWKDRALCAERLGLQVQAQLDGLKADNADIRTAHASTLRMLQDLRTERSTDAVRLKEQLEMLQQIREAQRITIGTMQNTIEVQKRHMRLLESERSDKSLLSRILDNSEVSAVPAPFQTEDYASNPPRVPSVVAGDKKTYRHTDHETCPKTETPS